MSPIRRIILEGHCYHTISATNNREPIFKDDTKAAILLGAINQIRTEKADVLAYCILPDHLHIVLVPREPWAIPQVMQSIKGFSSREINRAWGTNGRLWQPGYYDRMIRDDEQLRTVVNYVEFNPVEAKIVATPQEYRWSSAFPGAGTDIARWSVDDRG